MADLTLIKQQKQQSRPAGGGVRLANRATPPEGRAGAATRPAAPPSCVATERRRPALAPLAVFSLQKNSENSGAGRGGSHSRQGARRQARPHTQTGRTPKLNAHQKREALERRERGDETHAEIGRSYNVSGWTISRLTA
jgi:hypothetical protein